MFGGGISLVIQEDSPVIYHRPTRFMTPDEYIRRLVVGRLLMVTRNELRYYKSL